GEFLRGNRRVIQVMESFPHSNGKTTRYCLVLELAKHGALADWFDRGGSPWPEKLAAREVVALLHVLDHLHGGGALHRDLTPFNVFVSAGKILKLGDFGIARHGRPGQGVHAGTFNLRWAPRAIADGAQQRWREEDDIYQVGQLLAALIQGRAEVISTKAVRRL